MRFSRLLLSVALLLLVSGCATQTTLEDAEAELFTIDGLKQQAIDASYRGMHRQALRHYQDILRRDPNNLDALLGAASSLMADGQAAMAEVYLERALTIEPDNTRAREERALAWLMQGRFMASRTELQGLLNDGVDRWRIWNALGVIADLDGRYESAVDHYQKALVHEPQRAMLYNNLGYSMLMARDYAGAEQVLRQALQHETTPSVRTVNNLAMAMAWQRRYGEAIEQLRSVVDEAAANNNIGYVAYLNQDYALAEAMFEKAIRLRPSFYERAASNLEMSQRKRRSIPSAIQPD